MNPSEWNWPKNWLVWEIGQTLTGKTSSKKNSTKIVEGKVTRIEQKKFVCICKFVFTIRKKVDLENYKLESWRSTYQSHIAGQEHEKRMKRLSQPTDISITSHISTVPSSEPTIQPSPERSPV